MINKNVREEIRNLIIVPCGGGDVYPREHVYMGISSTGKYEYAFESSEIDILRAGGVDVRLSMVSCLLCSRGNTPAVKKRMATIRENGNNLVKKLEGKN